MIKVGNEAVAYSRGTVLAAGPVVRWEGKGASATVLIADRAIGHKFRCYGEEVCSRRKWLEWLQMTADGRGLGADIWRRAWRTYLLGSTENCKTLPDGSCVGTGVCIHTPREEK